MFITVKYGERKEALFNPDCRLKLLLNSIRVHCKCDVEAQVDLCEVNGRPRNLPHHPPESYATKYLNPRETFVLIQIEKVNEKVSYKPLLKDKRIVTDDFLARLSKEAEKTMPRSPGERHNKAKRNSLKPGRSGTPVKKKSTSLKTS